MGHFAAKHRFPCCAVRLGIVTPPSYCAMHCGESRLMHTPSSSSWGQSGAGGSARLCLPSLPAEGLPGSAQQVIQVDRDTVLVCFDRECSWYQGWGLEGGGEGGQVGLSPQKGATPPRPAHQPAPCIGCVRIVNLLGEPTVTLAPVLTFDFPIETVGK